MKEKNINLELIRFFGILFVVAEHVLSVLLLWPNGGVKWELGIYIWTFVKVNVPLFLIVSASLSYNEDLLPHVFFLKKLKRVFSPILFWSVFYYYYNPLPVHDLLGLISSVFSGSSYYHLYFMYLFIGFSFFFPFINYLYFSSKKSFYFYFFILLLSCSIVPSLPFFKDTLSIFFKSTGMSFFGILLFYSFVPKLIDTSKISIGNKLSIIIFVCYFVFSCIFASMSIYLSRNGGSNPSFIINGGTIFIFILAVLFYYAVTLANLDFLSSSFKKFINLMGGLSFGIYLIHPVFLSVVINKIYQPYFSSDIHLYPLERLAYFSVSTIFVYIVSFLFVWILRKIPIIKMVV